MHAPVHSRSLLLALAGIATGAAMAQVYTQPTVGQQNTYTGTCMVTTCSGTYYDSGGAAGNYTNNVNQVFRTFCPNTAGQCVRATFTSFNLNDQSLACFGGNSGFCCDWLAILNGPVQNSPVMYYDCVASPGTITASNASGCLTFIFYSDFTIVRPGWAATLSCVPCAGGPSGTSNSDCAFATPVCADTPFSDASPGPGITAEGCSGCVTSENYTNWYRIQVQTSGTLSFTINPNNNLDDFDPVVFGPNVTCGALGAPVRCSYAIGAGNGNTGLGNGAVDNSEDVLGDQWVAPLNVTAGQTYYVMVNGWSATSGTNGFLLDWTGTASLNCAILPVELLYVRTACEGGRSLLEWATGSEINSSHFLIDRSPDGTNWKEVGRVNSVHQSTAETDYVFMDEVTEGAGAGFYRLRQVDLDGHVTHSQVVAMQPCSDGPWLHVVPNPAGDGVQVRIDANGGMSGIASLEVLDALGRTLISRPAIVPEGPSTIDLDLSILRPGSYQVRLLQTDGRVLQRTQVIKQ